MTIAPVKPGGWALEEKLTSAQMNGLQAATVKAIDGVDGGSYAPADDIVLDGPGKLRIEGTLEVATGGVLAVTGGATVNVEGDINLASGADLNVAGGGEILLASGGQVNVAGGGQINIASGGQVNVANGGQVNVLEGPGISVKDNGRVELLDGAALDLYSGSTTTLEDGANINVSGEVNVLTGGQIDVEDGGLINIDGLGRIKVLANGHLDVLADGILTVLAGGFLRLVGTGAIELAAAAQLKIVNAAAISFRLNMHGIPGDTTGWQPRTGARWLLHDVVAAHDIMFPLNLLPGDRLESLVVRVRGNGSGGAGHVTVPTDRPDAEIVSIDINGVKSAAYASAVDGTSGSVGVYDALHDLNFNGLALLVPSDPLYVRVTGEQGTGAGAIPDMLEIVTIFGSLTPRAFRGPNEIH